MQEKDGYIHAAIIDALSCVFLFDEALALVDEFESNSQPDVVLYFTMLSAARNQRNSSHVHKIYARITEKFGLDKKNLFAASVLLAITYAPKGDAVRPIQVLQEQIVRQDSVNKKIGLSWTMINDEIHEFSAQSRRHPQSKEIYAELNKLSQELIEHGPQIRRKLDNEADE